MDIKFWWKYSRISEKLRFSCWGVLFQLPYRRDKNLTIALCLWDLAKAVAVTVADWLTTWRHTGGLWLGTVLSGKVAVFSVALGNIKKFFSSCYRSNVNTSQWRRLQRRLGAVSQRVAAAAAAAANSWPTASISEDEITWRRLYCVTDERPRTLTIDLRCRPAGEETSNTV